MQITCLDCDKSQGTVEITLSKREMQMENVLMAADYEMITEGEYKVTYYIGSTDFEVMEELMVDTVNCMYDDLTESLVAPVKRWLADKKIRSNLRSKLREMLERLAVSYKSIKMTEYNLMEKLVDYKNIRLLVEINETKKVYIVFLQNIFGDLLKVYESALPDVHKNDYDDTIGEEIEGDMQKLIEFIKTHESELVFV